jgi:hypothetical protein
MTEAFKNPFRPGAGHMPPYLAGRTVEQDEMRRLLQQRIVMSNMVLTGLRGVGKTVLLEAFKPIAVSSGWLWAGIDLSESASISEESLSIRILADISLVTSALAFREVKQLQLGFARTERYISEPISYEVLVDKFRNIPGLVSDKLKGTLEYVWSILPQAAISGVIFAYDEAQNLADHSADKQFPLSLLLEVFQSLQRKNIPFMLVLAGLPTLFPKLVQSRTYSERMFHVLFLDKLNETDAHEAIIRPLNDDHSPIHFGEYAIKSIIDLSGGYPYFIQFICKEAFDVWIAKLGQGDAPNVPSADIIRKLDADFFQGRWARATDRQRELLQVVAALPNADNEFTVQEVVAASQDTLRKPFTGSHVSQMLSSLSESGLVYKNRYGKYSLAVPLLSQFIQRQALESSNSLANLPPSTAWP